MTDVPPPHRPALPAEDLTASISDRVREILDEAERSAHHVQSEVEARTARQAAETRMAAEADADRIRRAAESQAAHYLADARARVERYAVERERRIDELTGELMERAALLQRQLDEAIDVRARLDETLAALGDASRSVRAEADVPPEATPPIESDRSGEDAAAGPVPERLQPATNVPPPVTPESTS